MHKEVKQAEGKKGERVSCCFTTTVGDPSLAEEMVKWLDSDSPGQNYGGGAAVWYAVRRHTHTYTNARKDETTQRDRLEGEEEEEEKGKDEKSLRCADSEMQNSKIKGRR